MAAGRIDGVRQGTSVAVLSDAVLASVAKPVSTALAGIRPTVSITDPGGYLDFEALVGMVGDRTSIPARSPEAYIVDFIEPRMSDPSAFLGGRSLSILERLVSDIIPTFDDSEELRSLAGAVIADEIERHRELATRVHSGIAL
jgi:hypothetical protein